MIDALSYMIERSRFDERRLAGEPGANPRGPDPRLIDDAANALFACCYLQAHGTLFARAGAARRAASIGRALREAGLERQVVARLKSMAQGIGGFFHFNPEKKNATRWRAKAPSRVDA